MDLKLVHCAVCVAYILQDFSDINVDQLTSFIKSCLVSLDSVTAHLSCVVLMYI